MGLSDLSLFPRKNEEDTYNDDVHNIKSKLDTDIDSSGENNDIYKIQASTRR